MKDRNLSAIRSALHKRREGLIIKIFKIIPVLVLFTLLVAGCQPAAPTPTPPSPAIQTPTPATKPVESPTETPAYWWPMFSGGACVPAGTRTCRVVFVLPAQYYARNGRKFPDQFRKAGYAVTIASNAPHVVELCEDSILGAQPEENIPVDLVLAQVHVVDYDAVIFIGGLGCQDQWHDEETHRIAREAIEQRRVVGASGCGSTILAYAGLLRGKTATVCSGDVSVKHGQDYCAVLQSQGAVCSKASIVRDGLIVTAKQTSPPLVDGVIEVILESTR
jgi:putative intracellular protease/amidase